MEEDGEINEEAEGKDARKEASREETSGSDAANQNDGKPNHLRQSGSFRLDGNKRAARMVISRTFIFLSSIGCFRLAPGTRSLKVLFYNFY